MAITQKRRCSRTGNTTNASRQRTRNMHRALIFIAVSVASCGTADAVRSLQFASPLQSLTIPDPEVKAAQTTARKRFLERFRVGLSAEAEARKQLAEAETERLQADATLTDWADQAAAAKRRMIENRESFVESQYDKAVAAFDAKKPSPTPEKNDNEYQFVGVVNPVSKATPITWYARKKPEGAGWSVRLVHQNKEAIVKDLFSRGKVDIFAKYENTGITEGDSRIPKVTSRYTVRQRSWR